MSAGGYFSWDLESNVAHYEGSGPSPLALTQQQNVAQQSQLSGLAQYQQSQFNQQQQLGNLISAQMNTALPATDDGYATRRAKGCVEDGDKLISRIYFWLALLGPLAGIIVNKLVVRLDGITDDIERWQGLAHST